VLFSACAVRDAIGHIGGCLSPAVDQVRAGADSVEQECDVEKRATIAAVPRDASAEQLARAGIPMAAARLMATTNLRSDRWCEVIDGPESEGDKHDITRIECTESSILLPEVAVVTGSKLRMVVVSDAGPAGGPRAKLAKLTVIQ